MKKTVVTVLSILLVSVMLFSCGDTNVSYRKGADLAALSADLEKNISKASNLGDGSEDFIEFFLDLDTSLFTSSVVRTPTGALSIDEYAIFEAKDDESASKIAEALDKYLAGRKEAWDGRYNASEKPKLDNAKSFRYGGYVGYVILSSAESPAFLSALEKGLRA